MRVISSTSDAGFYDRLDIHESFDEMADGGSYELLPPNWLIGVADIVNSTGEIAAGRYKMVNTVGAAVISAQINGSGGQSFPFVFGGDGAAFAFWPEHLEKSHEALAAVRRWALEEFGLEMRGAIVPVRDVMEAGYEVGVARYAASTGVDYAMFDGGGISWAEKQMKRGVYSVEMAPSGTFPNLTGLSCRWTPMKPKNGTILSVLVLPEPDAPAAEVTIVMHEVLELSNKLVRNGHPVPEGGPGVSWPPQGLDLEAHATHGASSFAKRKFLLLLETLIAWIFFKTGLKAGGFDPAHYADTVGRNADFRKFEDGLKMTLDCDAQRRAELEEILTRAAQKGLVRYGLFEQEEAMMTCIVPSVTSDDHLHFVDGAAGGYTQAALMIKAMG